MKSVFLLTGMPGTGKTSLIKQAAVWLKGKAGGFYTEEIRIEGNRLGFCIMTLEQESVPLAHVNTPSPYHVSKYGVDLQGLNSIGVAALREAAKQQKVVIVDEIGKMEIYSDEFKSTISEIIDNGHKVLGTIMLKSDPWADTIKKKPQVHLITVTRLNHPQVWHEMEAWLKE